MVGTVSRGDRSTQRRPIGLGRSRLRRDFTMIEFSGPTPPVASVGGGDGERSQSASIFTEVSSALRTASAAVTFEVVLRSGTTVRVPEHFDPGALSILLQTLRGC